LDEHDGVFEELAGEKNGEAADGSAADGLRFGPSRLAAGGGEPVDACAHEEEEAGGAEVGDEAGEEGEDGGVGAHGSGPELAGVLAGEEGAGVIDGHEDHDEATEGVDGLVAGLHGYEAPFGGLSHGWVESGMVKLRLDYWAGAAYG